MAAPETQRQSAGINVPIPQYYQYHPQAVNVPSDAGRLWAQVGQNLLAGSSEVFKTLMSSPLNPEVKAQMKEGQMRAEQGQRHLAWLNDPQHPERQLLQAETAQGLTEAPAISAGEKFAPTFVPNTNPPPPPPAPSTTTTTTTGGTGSVIGPEGSSVVTRHGVPLQIIDSEQGIAADQRGNPWYYNTGTGDWDTQPQAASQQASTATGRGPGMPGSTGSVPQHHVGGYIFAPSRPIQAPAAPGVMRFQEGGPVPQEQHGLVWDPQQPGFPQQPQPHVAQAVAESQRQQDLANWQNQTQTEPMTADDAMKYIRRKTTLAQDATYLPHGGPNNEPAFAFHMKGGGINTIPLSQMVKDGAGPTVAAQNTSAVLSQSDRVTQPQQVPEPQQQPGQVWNPQQPAPGPVAPVQGPAPGGAPATPPAPGQGAYGGLEGAPAPPAPGQGPYGGLEGGTAAADQQRQDALAQARQPIPGLGAYTNVASTGGPSAESLTAQADQGEGKATQPGTGTYYTAASDAEKQSALQAQAGQTDEGGVSKDPHGDYPWYARKMNLTWYWDPEHGQAFAYRPEDADHPFLEQRLSMTSPDQWEHNFATPENRLRQQVYDYFMGPKAFQSFDAQGNPMKWTVDMIKNANMKELQAWLSKGRYLSNTKETDFTNDPDNATLVADKQAMQAAQKLKDITSVLDPKVYSEAGIQEDNRIKARQSNIPRSDVEGLGPTLQQGLSDFWGQMAGREKGTTNQPAGRYPIVKDLEQQINVLADNIRSAAGAPPVGKSAPGQPQGGGGLILAGGGWIGTVAAIAQQMMRAGRSSEDIDKALVNQITSLLDNQDPKITQQKLTGLIQDLGTSHNRVVSGMMLNQKRVPDESLTDYDTYKNTVNKGTGRVPDPNNKFFDPVKGPIDPYKDFNPKPPGTAAPTPTPTKPAGMEEPKDMAAVAEFRRAHPGVHYWFNGQEWGPKPAQ